MDNVLVCSGSPFSSGRFPQPLTPSSPVGKITCQYWPGVGRRRILTYFLGGHPPPQTSPISRPGGLRNSLSILDFQYKSIISEASRPTYWGGLGGGCPPRNQVRICLLPTPGQYHPGHHLINHPGVIPACILGVVIETTSCFCWSSIYDIVCIHFKPFQRQSRSGFGPQSIRWFPDRYIIFSLRLWWLNN